MDTFDPKAPCSLLCHSPECRLLGTLVPIRPFRSFRGYEVGSKHQSLHMVEGFSG